MRADAETEAEVLATFERFNDANCRQDVAAAVDLFAQDDDVIVADLTKERKVGPQELRTYLQILLSSTPGGFSWTVEWHSVSASGSVSWLTLDALEHYRTGEDRATMYVRITVVLEKRDNKWVWMLFNISAPKD